MPYLIKTRRSARRLAPGEATYQESAVATLEEARAAADDRVADTYYKAQKPGDELPPAYFEHSTAARALPEPGGTVGPLPDGTVIEVERPSWHDLRYRSGPIEPLELPPIYTAEHVGEADLHPELATAILAAFNARQTA